MHYPVLAPVARSPIEVLSKAMGHAVHVGLASFVPKASAYADPKVGTEGSVTVPKNVRDHLLSGDPDEIASRLLNLLPSSDNNPGSDFYEQQAHYALTVLVGALQAANKRYTVMDLATMLQSAAAIGKVESLVLPDSQEFRVLQVFLAQFKKRDKNGSQVDVNKLKDILGGVAGRIAGFAQGKFGRGANTATPEIHLPNIGQNDSAPVRVKPCTVHPQVANCSVLAMFPQSWGSTALGFGGIGGQAITLAYTVLIQGPAGDIAVYWDGEFAYRIVPESILDEELKSWQDDVRYSTTAAVAQAVKRYGAKTEGAKRSWMGTKRR